MDTCSFDTDTEVSHVQALPEDTLADVLRCLAPGSLAVCRCVCKAWHAVIDGHRLLRAELLPLSMSGIFINFCMLGLPEFFSCAGAATTTTAISGDLTSYAPKGIVVGHCNGLLLGFSSVVNPATRQWAPLPRLAPPCAEKLPDYQYLAFDPAVSPHYEVVLMPVVPMWWFELRPRDGGNPVTRARSKSADWPPSLWETLVFSSRTGLWEERSFARKGEPAGTMADMARADSGSKHYSSVYWHRALYVLHSRNNFLCRVSLATNEYQVIKPPVKNGLGSGSECYLGRSKKGVYCAILDHHKLRFRVWILDESPSSHQMKWVLKHRNNLNKALASLDYSYQPVPEDDDGPWSFQDINYYARFPEEKHRSNGQEDGSDDKQPPVKPDNFYSITILGFHPFKEIVYLSNLYSTGLAYHLDSSKVQYLGNMCPKLYGVIAGQHADIGSAFPYTPCWMDNLFITGST